MSPSKGTDLLARVNFPLYTVRCLSERHIVVAGGGGTAKTGIENAIEIFEIVHENGRCKGNSVTRMITGDHAVMNSCVFYDGKNYAMAAGMDNFCQLYSLKWKILRAENEDHMLPCKISKTEKKIDSIGTTVRKRHRTNSSSLDDQEHKIDDEKSKSKTTRKNSMDSNGNTNSASEIGFEISKVTKTQTDFCKDEPYQKVVKVTPDGSVIVTAGADGSIRSWKYPKMKLLYTIKAHSTEVDDMDISPRGDKIVSVSSDGHSYIWHTKNGTKDVELKWQCPHPGEKYLMKLCRFASIEGKKSKEAALFTVAVPAIRKKPPLPCYLCKWNCSNYAIAKVVPTSSDIISTFTVSDNGRFLAFGTLSGDVHLYIAFSLQRLKVFERVHNIFITGLEFLSSTQQTKMITGGKEVSIISISVDNHINISHVDEPSSISLSVFVFILVGCLIMTFLFCDLIGL